MVIYDHDFQKVKDKIKLKDSLDNDLNQTTSIQHTKI